MLCPVDVATETEPLRYSDPVLYWGQDGKAWIPSLTNGKGSRSCQVNLRPRHTCYDTAYIYKGKIAFHVIL